MRTDAEIHAEIKALQKALSDVKNAYWSAAARETVEESIRVLKERMSADEIQETYYVDETMSDFHEGDNDLYSTLMLVYYWMIGDDDYLAPSKKL
jgi:hypothetical protein